RPTRNGRPVGRLRHLEVVYTGDVLADAPADIPDVDAKGECVFVFMGKSDSTRPGPPVFIPYAAASRSLPRFLGALLRPRAEKANQRSLERRLGHAAVESSSTSAPEDSSRQHRRL